MAADPPASSVRLLAIETATEACSAALYLQGELTHRYAVQPRGHSELILQMVEDLLGEAEIRLNQLDTLAFGRGPGSFTGVRIATGVIQGLAFGCDLPVVPVSTLATLAQGYHRKTGAERILPAFDARVREVYWAAYTLGENGLVALMGREQVCAPDAVTIPPGRGWHGVGTGWGTYDAPLRKRLGDALVAVDGDLYCNARDLALLAVAGYDAGDAVPAEQALPVYLRDEVAWKKGT